MLRGSRAFSGKIHRPFLAQAVPPFTTRVSGGDTWRCKQERLKIRVCTIILRLQCIQGHQPPGPYHNTVQSNTHSFLQTLYLVYYVILAGNSVFQFFNFFSSYSFLIFNCVCTLVQYYKICYMTHVCLLQIKKPFIFFEPKTLNFKTITHLLEDSKSYNNFHIFCF